MTLQEVINSTAQQLGIRPEDLATVISYETAGSFDPLKAGPTTQWGQHRGLIQWGEPQARKYGIDWKDIASQGRGMVQYFKDAGLKPGMGLMDIYSAVNAGRVGRYNASDAGNGGAPGTVADKVNDQMAGHQVKAANLLSRNSGPRAPDSAGPSAPYDPLSSIATPAQSPSQGPGEAVTASPWDYISANRKGLEGFGAALGDMSGGGDQEPTLDPRKARMQRMTPVEVEGSTYTRRKQPSIYDLIAQGGY
jgi:hypothetical protein